MSARTSALILVALLSAIGLVAATQTTASIVTENGFSTVVNLTAEKQSNLVIGVDVSTANVGGNIAIQYGKPSSDQDFIPANMVMHTGTTLSANSGMIWVNVTGTDSGGKKGYLFWVIDPATLTIHEIVPNLSCFMVDKPAR